MTESMECQNTKSLLWDNIPNELLIDIYDYLSKSDLLQMRLVCKRWRDVAYLPKFFQKFKLVVSTFNLEAICEGLANDKDLSKRLAYESLHIHKVDICDNMHLVLKSLGPYVRSLYIFKSQVFSILNDYVPELEELIIIELQRIEKENIFALDLSKFKNFKSLDISHSCAPHYAKKHLIISLIDDPPFKMENLSLGLDDEPDIEALVIRTLKYHSRSLKSLELIVRSKLMMFDQWDDVFPLLDKLEIFRMTGDVFYHWLYDLFVGIPKTAPLRECDLNGGISVDDKVLKLITDKWYHSLEDVNLSFCRYLTNDGVQHLAKLRHRLKVLNVAFCTELRGDDLLESLAVGKNTTLKTLLFNDNNHTDLLSDQFPELTYLSLENCRTSVNNHTLQSMFQHQRKLRRLNLDECRLICDEGLIGFGATPAPISNLKGLQSLSLLGCKNITDRSLIHAFKFNELRRLTLGYCTKITPLGIKELVKNCSSLENLSILSCCMIDDNATLCIVQGLKRLTCLNISNCELITAKSFDHVAEYCKSLKSLHICGFDPLELPEVKKKLQKLLELNISVRTILAFRDSCS